MRGALAACAEASYAIGDHPRMCGEHAEDSARVELSWGSSPHVRGAHIVHRAVVADDGIIPACAGSTLPFRTLKTAYRDHPRMCGEHGSRASGTSPFRGSSPHVRGAHRSPACNQRWRGIIPACAGSTLKYLAFLGYSSAFSFGSQGSKLFTCVVFYPPNFRAL